MTFASRAAIVGVAESDLGYTPGKTVLQLQAQAAKAALEDAAVSFDEVDALFCAGNWAWSPNLMLAEYLVIRPKYTDTPLLPVGRVVGINRLHVLLPIVPSVDAC